MSIYNMVADEKVSDKISNVPKLLKGMDCEMWYQKFFLWSMRHCGGAHESLSGKPPEIKDFCVNPNKVLASEHTIFRAATDKYWQKSAYLYSVVGDAVEDFPDAKAFFLMTHQNSILAGQVDKFCAKTIIDAIKTNFKDTSEKLKAQLQGEFGGFIAGSGESGQAYTTRFETLLGKLRDVNATPTDSELKSRFLAGLQVPQFYAISGMMAITTFENYSALKDSFLEFSKTKAAEIYLLNAVSSTQVANTEVNYFGNNDDRRNRLPKEKRYREKLAYSKVKNEKLKSQHRQTPGNDAYTGCYNCGSKKHKNSQCPKAIPEENEEEDDDEKHVNNGKRKSAPINEQQLKKQKMRPPILTTFRDKSRGKSSKDGSSVNMMEMDTEKSVVVSEFDENAFIDSCASHAMAILRVPDGNISHLCDRFHLVDKHINTATKNGTTIKIFATGDIADWKKILFARNISRNLISSKRLNNMGYSVVLFDGIQIVNSFTKEVVLRNSNEYNGMPYVPLKDLLALPNLRNVKSVSNISDRNPLMSARTILHERCGHYNEGVLIEGHKRALIEGTGLKREDLVKRKGEWRNLCSICARAKITRHSFPSRIPYSELVITDLDRRPDITADIAVYLNCPALSGETCVLGINHSNSNYLWCKGLVQRDGPSVLKYFQFLLEGEFKDKKITIRWYHCDGAGELIYQPLKELLAKHGCVKFTYNAPDTPEQNAKSERRFRTAGEMSLSMLLRSGLPAAFWLFAYNCAVHILNRMPTKSRDRGWITPHEYINNEVPHLGYFRVWGCKAYVRKNRNDIKKDWQDKARTGYFVAYSFENGPLGYKVYLPSRQDTVTSIHVLFDENIPTREEDYFKEIDALKVKVADEPKTVEDFKHLIGTYHTDDESGLLYIVNRIVVRKGLIVAYRSLVTAGKATIEDTTPIHIADVERMNLVSETSDRPRVAPTSMQSSGGRESVVEGHRTLLSDDLSTTVRSTDTQFDCVVHAKSSPPIESHSRVYDMPDAGRGAEGTSPLHSSDERTTRLERRCYAKTLREMQPIGELNSVSIPDLCENSYNDEEDYPIPENHQDVLNSAEREEWLDGTDEEKRAIKRREVLELVKRPKDAKLLRCKYVYRKKRKQNGKKRYKVRLVIQGCQQEKNENQQTFAPVVKGITIRILFAFAFLFNFYVHQLDITSAFCYADLSDSERVYMGKLPDEEMPKGFCFRLKKALYGLRSSPRNWNKHIDKYIKSLHFIPCVLDTCLYYRWHNWKLTLILVYVDDIIIASQDLEYLIEIKTQFCSKYEMTDLGECKKYLNVRITRTKESLMMDQTEYAESVIHKYSVYLGERKVKKTPLPSNVNERLTQKENLSEEEQQYVLDFPFLEIVGALLYLTTFTRPDLSYAVNTLSRLSHKKSWASCELAVHVLLYLKGTTKRGINFSGSLFDLHAFSDADWAGDLSTRRSTTGYIIFLCEGPIAWMSKLQTTVATSSMESEYMAMYACIQELVWIRGVFRELELGKLVCESTPLFVDNESAKALAQNPVHHKRSKHIDIKWHWIRQHIGERFSTIILKSVFSEEMAADMFTKQLAKDHFQSQTETSSGLTPSVSTEVEEVYALKRKRKRKRPHAGF